MPILPHATWTNFKYVGSFRLPKGKALRDTYGGDFTGNRGGIGLHGTDKMIVNGYLLADSNNKPSIAEVIIPALDSSNTFEELPIAEMSQGFKNIYAIVDHHGEAKDALMYCYDYNGLLIGDMINSYDANAIDTHFMWRSDNPNDIVNSNVEGLFELEGKYNASGWISPVPDEWQTELGYKHIMGNAHNFSISRRSSIGPSCFGIDLNQLVSNTVIEPIKTEAFMNYPHAEGRALFATAYPNLIEQYGYRNVHYNIVIQDDPIKTGLEHVSYPDQSAPLGNDIWAVGSRAAFGFIVPGTSTYAVLGHLTGAKYGVGYKIVDSAGTKFSGYSPYIEDDWSHHIWLFDVNDFLEVKAGKKLPHEILPYDHHDIDTPWEGINNNSKDRILAGGTFDSVNNRLYLTVRGADNSKPIIMAYDLAVGAAVPELPPIEEPPVIIPPDTSIEDAKQTLYDAIDNLVTVLSR